MVIHVSHKEDIGYDVIMQRSPDYSTPTGAMASTTLQSVSQDVAVDLLSPTGVANPVTSPPIYRKIVLSASLDGVLVDKFTFVTRWS